MRVYKKADATPPKGPSLAEYDGRVFCHHYEGITRSWCARRSATTGISPERIFASELFSTPRMPRERGSAIRESINVHLLVSVQRPHVNRALLCPRRKQLVIFADC